jgi:putative transposase
MDEIKDLPTIWEVSDELWLLIEPILQEDHPIRPGRTKPRGRGRPPVSWRRCLNGIIYRMRTSCQWNQLPKQFGDDSTVHRWFQRWCNHGVMEKIWALLVQECQELDGVHWEWQSADGSMGKARFGGEKIGKNPTDRAKMGTKRSLIVDEQGGPLGAVIAGANVHDTKLLEATIEAIVVERPEPTAAEPQNLCLDKAYDNPTGTAAVNNTGYTGHVRRIGEEKKPCDVEKGHKPRRWVVERTHAWLSKCRALLVRYDKNFKNYLGLLQLACGLIWFRRLHRLKNL